MIFDDACFQSEGQFSELSLQADLHAIIIKPLSANPTIWSNTLKQFVGKLPTNCLSVFDHFVKLALKGLSLLDVLLANIGDFWRVNYLIGDC